MNRAITLVLQTVIFADNYHEWKRLPAYQKTWLAFKEKCALAHQEWQELQATLVGAHFGNNIIDQTHTDNAISELATIITDDHATMVSLTASVQTLTTQLAATQNQLVTALATDFSGERRKASGQNC